jgi:hypothetical protein
MVTFGRETALLLIKPLILDIIRDIIQSGTIGEGLRKVKAEVVELIMNLVHKTHFSWDDRVAEIIIAHMLDGARIDTLTAELLERIEVWVKSSETVWDDAIVLPAIEQFRMVITGGVGNGIR